MQQISVIIPCYNASKTISETLDSIVEQTYKNIEIITVNDGSMDNTLSVLNQYKINHPGIPITIIDKVNEDASIARNTGAEIATGYYMMFLDSDDKLHKDYIERAITLLKNDTRLKMVYSKAKCFDAKNSSLKYPNLKLPDFLLRNCIVSTAGVFTKETFDKIGGFDSNLSFIADWEFWLRLLKEYGENSFYRINDELFLYRIRSTKDAKSDLNKIDNISDKEHLYMIEKHYDFYKENNASITDIVNRVFKHQNKIKQLKPKFYNLWFKKLLFFFKKRK